MRWRVIGGSAAGSTHLRVGRPCEDAFGWLIRMDGVLCLAIADGAGSSRYAAEASSIAVRVVLAWAHRLDHSIVDAFRVREAFEAVLETLTSCAHAAHTPIAEFATTLAVVLVSGNNIHIGQIGDGVVVTRDEDGIVYSVSPAERYEYANETTFVTSAAALEHVRVETIVEHDVTGLALSTDGLRLNILENPSTGEPYQPFFEDLFSYACSPGATSAAVVSFLARLSRPDR